MTNKDDLIELGKICVDVFKALYQALQGRREDELSEPLRVEIGQLTT